MNDEKVLTRHARPSKRLSRMLKLTMTSCSQPEISWQTDLLAVPAGSPISWPVRVWAGRPSSRPGPVAIAGAVEPPVSEIVIRPVSRSAVGLQNARAGTWTLTVGGCSATHPSGRLVRLVNVMGR